MGFTYIFTIISCSTVISAKPDDNELLFLNVLWLKNKNAWKSANNADYSSDKMHRNILFVKDKF